MCPPKFVKFSCHKKVGVDTRKLREALDRSITLTVVIISWCLHMSKLIKSYTLNMCSPLYINYTLIIYNIHKLCSAPSKGKQFHTLAF